VLACRVGTTPRFDDLERRVTSVMYATRRYRLVYLAISSAGADLYRKQKCLPARCVIREVGREEKIVRRRTGGHVTSTATRAD